MFISDILSPHTQLTQGHNMATMKLKHIHVQYTIAGAGGGHKGYRVVLYVQPMLDDAMDSLFHEGLLRHEEAERLVKAIKAKGEIDLERWVWSPSLATGFGHLQVAPTAVLKTEFYTPKF